MITSLRSASAARIAVFSIVEADDGRYLVKSTLAAGAKANLSYTLDRSYIHKSDARLLKILRVPKPLLLKEAAKGYILWRDRMCAVEVHDH